MKGQSKRSFDWCASWRRLDASWRARRWSPRRARWLAAALVVVTALLPRILLLLQLRDGSPTFDDPEGGDSRFYDRVAAGGTLPDRAYFHSPLYQWFLTGLYRVFGRDLLAVRAVQLAAGVVTALLVYWLAVRLFRRGSVATVAGVMAGLLGPTVFYEGQLLVDGLMALLLLVVLHLLLDALRRPTAGRWALVGVALGIAALGRPVVLVWLPLLCGFVARSDDGRRQRSYRLAALVAGTALAILPVTLRNYLVEGDIVLITANGGLNLFIGNNPSATGGYTLPQGLWFRPGDPLDDFAGVAVASEALGHAPSSSELSRWWAARAGAFVVAEPLRALDLLGQKLRILLNDYEYPQMFNYDAYGEVAPVLRALPRAALVVPAGLAGLGAMWLGRHGARRRLFALLVLSLGLVFLPFFVVGRYRVAWLVLLSPFAAWALVRMLVTLRGRRWRQLGALLGATSIGVVAAFVPLRSYPTESTQHVAFARASLARNDPAGALRWSRRATEVDPDYADAWALRARALRLGGQTRAAIELLDSQRDRFGESSAILSELGAAWLAEGDPAKAMSALEQSIELQPAEVDAWWMLGVAAERLGCVERAMEAYGAVVGLAAHTAKARSAEGRIRRLEQPPADSIAPPEPDRCSL